MKTKEELNALKNEVEAMNKKLAELTEEEFSQISGGQSEGRNEIESFFTGSRRPHIYW